jgi:KDO2-lipid IV(A) lauroyltransferase
MWRHLFLMIFEIANAPRKIHRTNWRNHFTVKNNRALMELMLGARPIVMVSGHFGNFEMASFMAGLLGFPSYTIARPLDNPYLDRYVNSFRGMHGQFIVTKQGSSGQLNRILSEGGKIAMLGDQAAGPRGCWVDFLGRPASCHKAVSLFTLTSGAPLLVCYTRRRQHPLDFELGLVAAADPEVDDDLCQSVRSLTSWYNAMLEGIIREYPSQYWWVHRRWKGQPRQRRRLAQAG